MDELEKLAKLIAAKIPHDRYGARRPGNLGCVPDCARCKADEFIAALRSRRERP